MNYSHFFCVFEHYYHNNINCIDLYAHIRVSTEHEIRAYIHAFIRTIYFAFHSYVN
jgi:hypothetical protein